MCQEREEFDFFPQSEYQNALAISRMNRLPDHSDSIHRALNRGKIVVVAESSDICPLTDACLGTSSKWLLGTFDERKDAEQYMQEHRETFSPDDFVHILPTAGWRREPTPPTDDSIPF